MGTSGRRNLKRGQLSLDAIGIHPFSPYGCLGGLVNEYPGTKLFSSGKLGLYG